MQGDVAVAVDTGVTADPVVELVDEVLHRPRGRHRRAPRAALRGRRPLWGALVPQLLERVDEVAGHAGGDGHDDRHQGTISTTITATQRGITRSTRSTAGSISRATTAQATTQPIVRWAATKASRATKAVTTAPTSRNADAGVSPARWMRTRRAASVGGHGSKGNLGRATVPVDPRRRCHHRNVQDEDSSALRIDPEELTGARVRFRLDWKTSPGFVLAALVALAADRRRAEHGRRMLTRIGIGVVIALALDPARRRHRDGAGGCASRGFAVGIVAVGIFGLAALLIVVLGPHAVAEGRKFSEQLPEETVDDLESLPSSAACSARIGAAHRIQDWL